MNLCCEVLLSILSFSHALARVENMKEDSSSFTIYLRSRSSGSLIGLETLGLEDSLRDCKELRLKLRVIDETSSESDLRLTDATATELNFLPLDFYAHINEKQMQQLLMLNKSKGEILVNLLDFDRLVMIAPLLRSYNEVLKSEVLEKLRPEVLCLILVAPHFFDKNLSLEQHLNVLCIHDHYTHPQHVLHLLVILGQFKKAAVDGKPETALWNLTKDLRSFINSEMGEIEGQTLQRLALLIHSCDSIKA